MPGAPVITERGTGTRHVPCRSPWGGYDLAHTAVDPQRRVTPSGTRRHSADLIVESTGQSPVPGSTGIGA